MPHNNAGSSARLLAVLVIAPLLLFAFGAPAAAEDACNNLSLGFSGNRFRGGNQNISTVAQVKANIESYNPYVTYYPPQYGDSSAWVMLTDQSGYAQAGYGKGAANNPPTIYDSVVFTEIQDNDSPNWRRDYFDILYARNAFWFQTSTDRAGFWYFSFTDANGPRILTSFSAAQGYLWTPNMIQLKGETLRYYGSDTNAGDQMVGDRGASTKVHFRYVNYAFDLRDNWIPASLDYTPISTPRPQDNLYIYDGNTFAIWDGRCPNY